MDQSREQNLPEQTTAEKIEQPFKDIAQAPKQVESKVKKFFKTLGPGLITGASDDDPSGIATYSQTGAQFGHTQLWTALFTFPLQTAIQEMCARIGLVTGEGLAGIIRKNYAKPVLYTSVILLFIANTINVGADLGAMADAARLLVPHVPFLLFMITFTVLSLTLEILTSYKTYSKFLKFLTFSLFAYFATAFVVKENWFAVLQATVVPHIQFSQTFLMNIVAILGTTISPYLFFWQTNEEVEEQIEEGLTTLASRQGTTKRQLQLMRTDVIAGMFFSNIVMWFIIITTAATLFAHGMHTIDSAPQAAEALRPFAGKFAYLLFALGIIGTGLLAIPVLSGSAAYALSEALKWHEGLNKKLRQAPGFYAVVVISVAVGFAINFVGHINPIKMLYYTAIINGIVAPPLLFLIVKISSNKGIMGDKANKPWSNLLGYITFAVMAVSAILLILSLLHII